MALRQLTALVVFFALSLVACRAPAEHHESVSSEHPAMMPLSTHGASVADAGTFMGRRWRQHITDAGAHRRTPAEPRVLECIKRSDGGTWQTLRDCIESSASLPSGAHSMLDRIEGTAYATVTPNRSNPSWLIPDWYVNNSTGSDSNTCVTSGAPCKTVGEIEARWGSDAPTLAQATTIHFLADDTTENRIAFEPDIVHGGSFTLLGDGVTTVLSGALSGVVAKDRTRSGTPCPGVNCPALQASWTGISSAQVGMLIVNTTRASSVAWVDAVSGGVAVLTQPLAANVPTFATFPAENNAWANGDSFAIVRPVQVNLTRMEPNEDLGDNSGDAIFVFVGHLWLPDPTGTPGQTYLETNPLVRYAETRIDTYTLHSHDFGVDGALTNAWAPGSGAFTSTFITGGSINASSPNSILWSGILDGDVIVHGSEGVIAVAEVTNPYNLIGYAFLEDANSFSGFQVQGTVGINGDAYGGNGVVYGSYTFWISAGNLYHFDTAANTFLGTPTYWCGVGTSAAGARDYTHTFSPFYPAITPITTAKLDMAVASGGFGGNAECDDGFGIHREIQSSAAPTPFVVPLGNGGQPNTSGCASGQVPQGASLACGPVVDSLTAGSGISLSASTGSVTITNTGSSGISCPVNLATCTTGQLPVASIAPCASGQIIQTNAGTQTCVNTSTLLPSNTVPNGFTGATSFPAHSTLLGEGTSPISSVGPCAAGVVQAGNGASADPTCQQLQLNNSATFGGTTQVANGGSGSTSFPAFSVLLGNATSPFSSVGPSSNTGWPLCSVGPALPPAFAQVELSGGAQGVTGTLGHVNGGTDGALPGAAGNVLMSNGTNWTSQALAAFAMFDTYVADSLSPVTISGSPTTVISRTFTARAGHLDIDTTCPEATVASGSSGPATVVITLFVGSSTAASWQITIPQTGGTGVSVSAGGANTAFSVPATLVQVQVSATASPFNLGLQCNMRVNSYGF